ncbi:MAG: YwiC-like family protein [Deltaproteobacteria bacterium]|nr:YwiC-like family protein [Deltaproteobacteria bacterium]
MTADEASPGSAAAARPRRSLAPREHGAYGQLGVPLVAALAMGRPGAAALALTAAAALAFAAHEPLLVQLARRGHRARREDGPRAARALALTGGAAAILGALGLALSPAAARVAALAPVALGAAVTLLAARDQERTAPGEIAAAAALSGAALPVALAAGVPAPLAWWAWAAWCLSLSSSTLAVRSVIAHARRPIPALRRILPAAAAAGLPPALLALGIGPPSAALSAIPMTALALALAAAPPAPTGLRRVGWGLVATSVLAAAILVGGAHLRL